MMDGGLARSHLGAAPRGAASLAVGACAVAGCALACVPSPAGFAQALTPRAFSFPSDHGPHPLYRQEWWYVTGNLDAATGERFGFELTFFRFALAPPSASAPSVTQPPAVPLSSSAPQTSAWRARQIYMAHFAITDVGARRFRFAKKLSRDALGLAGAQSTPFRVWIDDWSLEDATAAASSAWAAGASSAGTATASSAGTATASSAGTWELRAAQPGYELELALLPRSPAVLNGEAGLSVKSAEPGSASYYYSIPRLKARGRLIRDGRAVAVDGLAWFDREWGSGDLGAQEAGWDWFAVQLEDGGTLMFYALRNQDGTQDLHSAGTWTDGTGAMRSLTHSEVTIEVADHWVDRRGIRYPARWRIRVPVLGLELSAQPVLADQEITGTPTYWEGAVDVSGTRAGRNIAGRGYVELVGYDAERPSTLSTGARGLLIR